MSMTVIEHIEVGSGGAASVTFADIPQDYTDLYMVCSIRSDRPDAPIDGFYVKINDGGYSGRRIFANPTSVSSQTIAVPLNPGDTATANTYGNANLYIPNYTVAQAHSWGSDSVGENNATSSPLAIVAGLSASTAAVTSLVLDSETGPEFKQYSTFTLYGIRNAASLAKATGGIISFDSANNKWVHTFTASGTFTPTEDLTAEYLVIAGGGGGGGGSGFLGGGGGGAGGYRSSVSGESSGGGASAETPLILTASTGYTVTVGAGGAAGLSQTNGSTNGGEGNNSVFSTITSDGGGGGGAGGQISGQLATDGGSGGGQGSRKAGSGSGTANQGFDGGEAELAGDAGGGGGGAGSAGETVTGIAGGDGGSGVSSSITGSSVARAGGGGGGGDTSGEGVGTAGGGDGADGYSATPTAGIANFGGGGGGGSSNTINGAAGGSGIVIVRYAA